MFDHVYAEPPAHLVAQREELARRLAANPAAPPADSDAVPPDATPMRGQRLTRR